MDVFHLPLAEKKSLAKLTDNTIIITDTIRGIKFLIVKNQFKSVLNIMNLHFAEAKHTIQSLSIRVSSTNVQWEALLVC